MIIEHVIVFLPYLPLIRHRWPVSSFRDSLYSKTGVTEKNRSFYYWSILRTKYFCKSLVPFSHHVLLLMLCCRMLHHHHEYDCLH